MAAALTTPPDVEAALLRPLTDTENNYIGVIIDQASALLRQAAPSVDTRIARWNADPTDPGAISPDVVSAVLAGVVKKYLVNPTGIASETNSVGPYSQSTSYALRSEKETRGVLQITDDDLAALFPNRRRLRAGTIRTRPGLAPRPVGRYGPPPTIGTAVEAVVSWSPTWTPDTPVFVEPDPAA